MLFQESRIGILTRRMQQAACMPIKRFKPHSAQMQLTATTCGYAGTACPAGYRDWSQWNETHPEQLVALEAERAKAADEAKRGRPPRLRVLIESRHGLTRVMKNLDEVLEACRREDKNGELVLK